jgi:hypothetical protein
VRKLVEDAAGEAGLEGSDWEGRVDLVLASGRHLLVLEFMRPGLMLDWDHVSRLERYILILRERVDVNTGGRFDRVTGYVIADGLSEDPAVRRKMADLERQDLFSMDWGTLFARAISNWQEMLSILASRAPGDERLQSLVGGAGMTGERGELGGIAFLATE